MNKKDFWFHRRMMAYASLCGLLFMTTPWSGVSDGIASALCIAFGAIIANYTWNATKDDIDARANS